MLVYTVEKENRTIGVFDAAIDLLLFAYEHKDEFGFDDRGEDLYTMIRSGESITKLNRYMQDVEVKQWNGGYDTYVQDEDKNGKHVRDIADMLPDASWDVKMTDGTSYNIVAPIRPLAVEKAHTEHILDTGVYCGVEKIKKL